MMLTRAEKRSDHYVVRGRKWYITGAEGAAHFILLARTSNDPRRGLTAMLFHADQPGWRIVRRIPIMGPEEHGGHCELEFDGLEVPFENVLLGEGLGMKVTQIRLGLARLTHCMRWLGMARRALELAHPYVRERQAFGQRLADKESVQGMLGEAAMAIEVGRLLTMRAAAKLAAGDRARKEVSMGEGSGRRCAASRGRHRHPAPGRQGLQQGYAARVDVPLRSAGSAGRRRFGGSSHGGRPRTARERPRVLLVAMSSAAPPVLDEASRGRLTDWLKAKLEAQTLRIDQVRRLGGGAIQENLFLGVTAEGGMLPGTQSLILRTDAPSSVPESRSRDQEFAILNVVHAAGLPVPRPIALEPDGHVLGKKFFVMSWVAGDAMGSRLVRDPAVLARGDAIAAELAAIFVRLHAIEPPVPELSFLTVPENEVIRARVNDLRLGLDLADHPQPVFEWGLRWLERNGPRTDRTTLIHSDLRTGNYLVHEGRITAILDWEFSRFADPLEDLGWLLARCWRFGRIDRHCGGIGSRSALLDAYEEASGRPLDRAAVRYWELFATVRWGMIALQQARRHYAGAEASLELGLTAHVVPVLEHDVMAYVAAIEEGRDL